MQTSGEPDSDCFVHLPQRPILFHFYGQVGLVRGGPKFTAIGMLVLQIFQGLAHGVLLNLWQQGSRRRSSKNDGGGLQQHGNALPLTISRTSARQDARTLRHIC